MDNEVLERLRSTNELAAFNRWAGFVVEAATAEAVTVRMPWRDEFGQYAGHLHAGLTSALIDTACGFAAVAATGKLVVASHCAVSYLAPGTGSAFVVTARTIKAGRRQIFVTADLFDERETATVLIGRGETILIPTD